MEGLLIWLGAKALVVAGLAALFVVVRFACVALLRRLPDGPLKRVLRTHERADSPNAEAWGRRENAWFFGLLLGGLAVVLAVYAYNTAY